jgi:hypothetical protein
MTTERDKALNDLIDVVASLTLIVEELNPGASEQIRRIRFLIGRAEDCVNRATDAGCPTSSSG